MSGFPNSKAYPWALSGIFAAFHLIITLIPFNIGFGGGSISFGLISAPILGFLLGPIFGVISVVIGSLIAMMINVDIAILGPFTVIATGAGAFAAGMIRSKKAFVVPVIFAIVIPLYLINPIGVLVPEFVWFHVIAFVLSLLFIIPKLSKGLNEAMEFSENSNVLVSTFAIWLLSIVAVTLDQAVGSAIGGYYFVSLLGLDAGFMSTFFTASMFVYPVERLFGSLLVTVILVGLGKVLSRSDFGLPLTSLNPFQIQELSPIEVEQG
ncbi:MAG: hypothetical protein ACTSU3_11055 [Candidatus Thorarchaeota archaeon]